MLKSPNTFRLTRENFPNGVDPLLLEQHFKFDVLGEKFHLGLNQLPNQNVYFEDCVMDVFVNQPVNFFEGIRGVFEQVF